jgi:pyrroline-5-carboxylate reductase
MQVREVLAVMDERGNAVLKGVDGMDKAKILRLLDEADDIVSALYRQGANKDYKCKSLREKLKAIAAEITVPPKSNADRIRQMTDEELAVFMIVQALMGAASANGISDRQPAENLVKEVIKSKSAEIDIENAKDWLKQEVQSNAGTD